MGDGPPSPVRGDADPVGDALVRFGVSWEEAVTRMSEAWLAVAKAWLAQPAWGSTPTDPEPFAE